MKKNMTLFAGIFMILAIVCVSFGCEQPSSESAESSLSLSGHWQYNNSDYSKWGNIASENNEWELNYQSSTFSASINSFGTYTVSDYHTPDGFRVDFVTTGKRVAGGSWTDTTDGSEDFEGYLSDSGSSLKIYLPDETYFSFWKLD